MGKSTRSTWKWFDSLLWLGIAGVLAALLVPAARGQVVCKTVPQPSKSLTANVDATGVPEGVLPSPYHDNDSVQYFPPGHEFILQNEADQMAELAEPTANGPLLAPPKQD